MSIEYLPTDLILQIISRLPSKSIARFRCLSKLWASLLKSDSPYFTELFFTHSKTRPRLLFAVQRYNTWLLYSCPNPQISYKNSESSLSITAEFHMSLPRGRYSNISIPISGLIYCYKRPNFNTPMLCNPTTRRLFRLPQPITKVVHSYFGYDPINKQFSVLAISHLGPEPSSYQILKLGSETLSWRNIECPLHHHYPLRANICINGNLYYIAYFGPGNPCKIACFDLNSEEFKFIDEPSSVQPDFLVNFKGKLGRITKNWKCGTTLEVSLWVLEDMEKQEWSKHVYDILRTLWITKFPRISLVGVTATGEIVLSWSSITHPFSVYFFNIEKNILREVEIKGFEGFKFGTFFQGFVDYVEDLKDLNWN